MIYDVVLVLILNGILYTVALARLFFPTEAKLAMYNANAETTSEFAGFSASKGSGGNFREVVLNETPIMQNKRLRSRVEALTKTGNCKHCVSSAFRFPVSLY